jgi:ABC-type antimicrobial peptide transport system permease subunit
MEDASSLRRRSLAIFDRSFAVTYALEAIAIAIGLAGVTSSFAAMAWSRKREFGVLRFLGLRRRDILAMLRDRGRGGGALGAAVGLVSGAAISLVLVHVVNRSPSTGRSRCTGRLPRWRHSWSPSWPHVPSARARAPPSPCAARRCSP